MKKLKYLHKLIIELEFNTDGADDIAASQQIIHRVSSIKKKYQLDDDQLQDYNDFISSILSIIFSSKYSFKKIKSHQSRSSYSYYIYFYPVDTCGRVLDAVEIEFRVSNHSNKGLHENKATSSNQVLIKTFIIGGKRYRSTYDVMNAVNHICEGLQKVDYTVLDLY